KVKECLKDLAGACKKGDNVMPYCIEAVKSYATVQEICDVYREVYGEYRDPGIF
ncbi:MAG: methylmalonyl-CoA mutase family protein, partial [Firmicutes bacterium]|nr:methylmalonyl-CoA mutase family protein [Bacillota bacterium]